MIAPLIRQAEACPRTRAAAATATLRELEATLRRRSPTRSGRAADVRAADRAAAAQRFGPRPGAHLTVVPGGAGEERPARHPTRGSDRRPRRQRHRPPTGRRRRRRTADRIAERAAERRATATRAVEAAEGSLEDAVAERKRRNGHLADLEDSLGRAAGPGRAAAGRPGRGSERAGPRRARPDQGQGRSHEGDPGHARGRPAAGGRLGPARAARLSELQPANGATTRHRGRRVAPLRPGRSARDVTLARG